MDPILPILCLLSGLLLGAGLCFLVMRGKPGLERMRGKNEGEAQIASLEAQVTLLTGRQAELGRQLEESRSQVLELTGSNAQFRTRLEEERARDQESRERMKSEFKGLADAILEEKTSKFTEQNKTNLEGLLNPLGIKIKEFEKKVEDAYGKETEQRNFLRKELEILNQTNMRMSQEAVNLTNALTGKSKVQGNLGEMILERVLEKSGLAKGREYDVQVSMSSEDGRRYQPDVIVNLPDGKHIVIDSKLSLTAYERYCSQNDRELAESELKNHIVSVRRHLDELSLKAYQNLYELKSLDFVFLFMPIEPALTLAVQNDPELFQDAFEKNVVIVSPSTLLATLLTVSSIWRQEKENRNAAEIARQAGQLYDKFVGFLESLEKVGDSLDAAQGNFEEAKARLAEGKGNLIGRVDRLKKLGAKTSKLMPESMLPGPGLRFTLAEGAGVAREEESEDMGEGEGEE